MTLKIPTYIKHAIFAGIGFILLFDSCLDSREKEIVLPQTEKYSNYIGYLNPENPDTIENFIQCNDTLLVGFYHSSAPHIYKGSKKSFRSYILKNFDATGYTDSGFLNIRFLINCKGDIGDMEINELNTDLEHTDLNDAMVDQLISLTLRKENWNTFKSDIPRDVYMYVIYKIENGTIAEILP